MTLSRESMLEIRNRFGMPPPASVQIDLDGYWAIRRCYGKPEDGTWEHDPVYEDGMPRLREALRRTGVQASLFAIGRDAAHPVKSEELRRARDDGHLIANHTATHPIAFSELSHEDHETEIVRAQEQIADAVGEAPTGIRTPGYNMNEDIMEIIRGLGLHFDASVLPSPWGFAFRTISQFISGTWRVHRTGQFGSAQAIGAPQWPYQPSLHNYARETVRPSREGLIEWPVSVDPLTRAPLTGTILLLCGWPFFKGALRRHRRLGLPLNLALHGIDFVDTHRYPPLDSIRGKVFFNLALERKMRLIERVLRLVRRHYRLTTAEDFALSMRTNDRT